MSACIRASSVSTQRLWLTATSRLCRCQRFIQHHRYPYARFSAFAFLSRKSKPASQPNPKPPQPPQPTPATPPTPPSPATTTTAATTTVLPDSSSPYLQEDTLLERVAIVGYGSDHFEVFNPSSLPGAGAGQQAAVVAGSAGEGGDESVAVTASVVSSVAAPATRSGLLSRGAFSAPNTISMFGGVIALPTAAFLWAPTEWSQVTVESLAILDLLQDKPDLILFGTGSRVHPLPPPVSAYLQQLGIGYEVLQSNNAMATFNMLADEQRLVMAALVPYGDEAGKKADEESEEERPSAALRRRIEEQLAQ